MSSINHYFDEQGVLLTWPSKRRREVQLGVLARLAAMFEVGRDFTEAEVNERLKARIAFPDYVLVRRELIETGLVRRSRDCRRYWREE